MLTANFALGSACEGAASGLAARAANDESARAIKQNKCDLLVTNAQKMSQEIDVHVQQMATLDKEFLNLHAELRMQEPIQPPPALNGPVLVGQEVLPNAPILLRPWQMTWT